MARMRQPLDDFGRGDTDMERYLYEYGRHFNRKLYEFAVSGMYKVVNGKREYIKPKSKDEYDSIMSRNGVKVENDMLYDGLYVMSMCEADFLGSSVSDEKHMCLFVKDMVDDPDQADGFIFNRFLASVRLAGEPVDWYGML